ncbi:hypothetical protein [Christiangramia crocea]|uniref:Glycosyl transferase n=1 Tax=Christiangramia crocea TaxID=2904124 RepID=A0A9X1V1G5_9FLAO|nr:hypothetical protein [Gramella crocea]MCG9973018.1 hypothetical protein [Gramella crocea]
MDCFCTIITADYLFFARTLHASLQKFDNKVNFEVLIVDGNVEVIDEHLQIYTLENIKESYPDDFEKIKRFESDPASNLRWALKPLFLKFLLTKEKFKKAIFIDPDIHFYNSPFFLFDELDKTDVLLTPHWRSRDPKLDSENFDQLFTGGLYNAGFFACTPEALNILDWWLEVCSYKMVKSQGFYVDQAYLNLLPVYFPGQVRQIEHRGCNVSNWNFIECERRMINNQVLINGVYPIIFIHFTPGTLKLIHSGKDKLLDEHLDEYTKALRKFNPHFEFETSEKEVNPEKPKNKYIKILKRKFKL